MIFFHNKKVEKSEINNSACIIFVYVVKYMYSVIGARVHWKPPPSLVIAPEAVGYKSSRQSNQPYKPVQSFKWVDWLDWRLSAQTVGLF